MPQTTGFHWSETNGMNHWQNTHGGAQSGPLAPIRPYSRWKGDGKHHNGSNVIAANIPQGQDAEGLIITRGSSAAVTISNGSGKQWYIKFLVDNETLMDAEIATSNDYHPVIKSAVLDLHLLANVKDNQQKGDAICVPFLFKTQDGATYANAEVTDRGVIAAIKDRFDKPVEVTVYPELKLGENCKHFVSYNSGVGIGYWTIGGSIDVTDVMNRSIMTALRRNAEGDAGKVPRTGVGIAISVKDDATQAVQVNYSLLRNQVWVENRIPIP